MQIKLKKLHPDAKIPTRAKPGDAGWDIYACDEPSIGGSFKLLKYPTGIAIEIPDGYYGQIVPRSSIYKTHLRLTNNVGIIDSGYRGEISFLFDYIGPDIGDMENSQFELLMESGKLYRAGDRIGQLIVLPYQTLEFKEVKELSESVRGTGGFGSSGTK